MPTDHHGHEYPEDWFDDDDLDDGQLTDDHGQYDPYAGNMEPVEGKCNAKLKHWTSRYPNARYCAAYPLTVEWYEGTNFCKAHQYKEIWMKQAKELFQHGANSKTREHFYQNCGPYTKLDIHAKHQSLLEDSIYHDEFAIEFQERVIDFSDLDELPDVIGDELDEGKKLKILVPHATEKMDRADSLWLAAVDGMKALLSNAEITESDMKSTTVTDSEALYPDEDNPDGDWMTLEENEEHYLNLAYSRVIRDREKLLTYGGVRTGTDADIESNDEVIQDEFITVQADPEGVKEGSGMVDVEPNDS